jgi:hypothetical protein
MSYTAEQLLSLANSFQEVTSDSLVKEAKKKEDVKDKKKFFPFWLKNKKPETSKDSNSAKDKSSKKLDPKAEVRNRGDVCVPAEKAKDKKDHFPINNENQARNALAQVNKFTNAPEWYHGSLQSLVSLVAKKVKAKYPSIEVSKDAKKPGKKKASDYYANVLNKFGQLPPLVHTEDPPGVPLVGGDAMVPGGQKLTIDPGATQNYLENLQKEEEAYQKKLRSQQQPISETRSVPTTVPAAPVPAAGVAKPAPKGYGKIDTYVQRALNELGYPLGTPDGVLGPATRKAIEKWKKDTGARGADEDIFGGIKGEYQRRFPGLQFAYNDPKYSTQDQDKPAPPLPPPAQKKPIDLGFAHDQNTIAALENEFFKKLGA